MSFCRILILACLVVPCALAQEPVYFSRSRGRKEGSEWHWSGRCWTFQDGFYRQPNSPIIFSLKELQQCRQAVYESRKPRAPESASLDTSLERVRRRVAGHYHLRPDLKALRDRICSQTQPEEPSPGLDPILETETLRLVGEPEIQVSRDTVFGSHRFRPRYTVQVGRDLWFTSRPEVGLLLAHLSQRPYERSDWEYAFWTARPGLDDLWRSLALLQDLPGFDPWEQRFRTEGAQFDILVGGEPGLCLALKPRNPQWIQTVLWSTRVHQPQSPERFQRHYDAALAEGAHFPWLMEWRQAHSDQEVDLLVKPEDPDNTFRFQLGLHIDLLLSPGEPCAHITRCDKQPGTHWLDNLQVSSGQEIVVEPDGTLRAR